LVYSNTKEFQARASKIYYKNGKKKEFVHTLNGSSLALGRTLVAIIENGQNADARIDIPKYIIYPFAFINTLSIQFYSYQHHFPRLLYAIIYLWTIN